MKKSINFVKLAGKWYIQLPDYCGCIENLMLKCGLDDLCEIWDKNKDGLVQTIFSTYADYYTDRLDIINSKESNETWYAVNDSNFEVKLNDVFKLIFGHYLPEFYVIVL